MDHICQGDAAFVEMVAAMVVMLRRTVFAHDVGLVEGGEGELAMKVGFPCGDWRGCALLARGSGAGGKLLRPRTRTSVNLLS